jgi:uncharacterized protein (DUF433 family)
MTLNELKSQVFNLSLLEKAELLQDLTQAFTKQQRQIKRLPDVCGGDACLEGTRISIWLLYSLRCQGSNDAELLSFYPQLNASDLVNVWAYAETHLDEIQQAIQENEAA